MKAQQSAEEAVWPVLWGMALLGGALRVFPFLRSGGALAFPIDYDEGVYFSAASLLLKGFLPYRDFVFVHPPGLLYFLGAVVKAVSAVDLSLAFTVVRWVAAGLGVLNTVLAGRIATRWAGPVAGMAAAAFYASYPDAVAGERGPFLEPLLNAACLAFAMLWLSRDARVPTLILAGLLGGVALSTKVWAGFWVLAASVSLPRSTAWKRQVPWALAAAVLTAGVLVLPLALSAPRAFFEQVLLFHAQRPPDGLMTRWPRLTQILGGTHVLSALFALLILVHQGWRSRRALRFFATVYILSVLAFLASSAYWGQYNAHLAASECVLAGVGFSQVWQWARNRWPPARVWERSWPGGLMLGVLLATPSALRAAQRGWVQVPQQVRLGEAIRDLVRPEDCLFSFEPARTVLGGRLQADQRGKLWVDTYGAMLWSGLKSGAHFAKVEDAFQSESSQADLRSWLESCRYVVLGRRGRVQMSAQNEAWFEAHFVRRFPAQAGEAEMDLWERL